MTGPLDASEAPVVWELGQRLGWLITPASHRSSQYMCEDPCLGEGTGKEKYPACATGHSGVRTQCVSV